jgi:hypothetical protein
MVGTLKFAAASLCLAVAAVAGLGNNVASAQGFGSLSQDQAVAAFRQLVPDLKVDTLPDGSKTFTIDSTRKTDGVRVTVLVKVSPMGEVHMVSPLGLGNPNLSVDQLNQNLRTIGQNLGLQPGMLVAKVVNGQVVICAEMVVSHAGSANEVINRFLEVVNASFKVHDVLQGQ